LPLPLQNRHNEQARPLCHGRFGVSIGFIAAVVLIVWACPARPAHAELLAHIEAAVNNDVITTIDLGQAVRFNAAFGKNEGVGVKKLEQETLSGLINRKLLLQEARRLRFVEVSGQDVAAETEKIGKRFASDREFSDFLTRLGMTRDDVARMLGERLLAERFIEKKIGLFVRVSRDEAQAYFNEHSPEYPGKVFQDVQKKVTALLMELRLGQQVDQYLADLRSKADIRVNP